MITVVPQVGGSAAGRSRPLRRPRRTAAPTVFADLHTLVERVRAVGVSRAGHRNTGTYRRSRSAGISRRGYGPVRRHHPTAHTSRALGLAGQRRRAVSRCAARMRLGHAGSRGAGLWRRRLALGVCRTCGGDSRDHFHHAIEIHAGTISHGGADNRLGFADPCDWRGHGRRRQQPSVRPWQGSRASVRRRHRRTARRARDCRTVGSRRAGARSSCPCPGIRRAGCVAAGADTRRPLLLAQPRHSLPRLSPHRSRPRPAQRSIDTRCRNPSQSCNPWP